MLAAKVRLDLVKYISSAVLGELRNKADDAYKDMNDWLGARFLKEMERYVCQALVVLTVISRSRAHGPLVVKMLK